MVSTTRKRSSNNRVSTNSLESLQEETLHKLLDLNELHKEAKQAEFGNDDGDDEEEEKKEKYPSTYSKLNTFVGFLRLFNYLSATAVLFGIAIVITWPDTEYKDEKLAINWVRLIYLVVTSILVSIDSIGTMTFRWKEYGELSHAQTDATSIIFIICPSRWAWRIGTSLVLASSVSLAAVKNIHEYKHENAELPDAGIWFVSLCLAAVASNILGFFLSLIPCQNVAWLYDSFDASNIEDQGDIWRTRKVTKQQQEEQEHMSKLSRAIQIISEVLTIAICLSSYLSAIGIHVYAVLLMCQKQENLNFLPFVATLTSAGACLVLNLCSLVYIVARLAKLSCSSSCKIQCNLPFAVKFFAPYTLTCASILLMDIDDVDNDLIKYTFSLLWSHLITLNLCAFLLSLVAERVHVSRALMYFLTANSKRHGVSKKTIRILDTIGSTLALTGMILGFISLFTDPYDLNFEPEGVAKDVMEACQDVQALINPVTTTLKKIIDSIDKKFTCQDVYNMAGTTAAAGLFATFFPGASTFVSIGSKSAYYGVRAANALTNVAQKLKKSSTLIWKVTMAVIKLNKFAAANLKKVILTADSVSLTKLMPFLPPVVIGIYVLFGSFWPQRTLFFSAKQRRKHMAGMFFTWTLALMALSVAITINTALVDELVVLLDENIPLAKVTMDRKLGWTLSMAASGLAVISCVLFWINSLILMWQTHKDHENITNEELDWKYELEQRELVVIKTAIGDKIEKKTQIKYKRERIGPWTWILPILLCCIACGFATAANMYPKLKMQREPRGPFGRLIDRVYTKVSVFEDDMYNVKNDTDMECLPYPTIDDVIREKGYSSVLMNPVNKFYNITQDIIRPLKSVLTGLRKQLILDVEDELFNGKRLEDLWEYHKLQYIGMILLVPRVACLFILIFGCLTSSLFTCQMRIICQSLEPKRIVEAFGKVTLFSVVYVVGSQLAIFNILSSFGVPFYHIYVKFGPGFVYDLVADSINVAVYIGMNNEFFFAIPKRKTVVTYSVPGVSDNGPNLPGQII